MVVDAGALQSNVMKGMVVALYFLPFIVAWLRGHHNKVPVFLLNLFLGWTGIGWLAALIWSASSIRRRTPVELTSPAASRAEAEDPYHKLEKLAELRDRGLLTAEEFEAEKAKILSR
ncbi:superinfection immunity protein [Pseudomonas sp. TWI929]|uniref:superinfection immunity protein n=1 Tax=Pseudomonas sp. TWI929 TaxID=3136795 RepID=UPI003207DC0B